MDGSRSIPLSINAVVAGIKVTGCEARVGIRCLSVFFFTEVQDKRSLLTIPPIYKNSLLYVTVWPFFLNRLGCSVIRDPVGDIAQHGFPSVWLAFWSIATFLGVVHRTGGDILRGISTLGKAMKSQTERGMQT